MRSCASGLRQATHSLARGKRHMTSFVRSAGRTLTLDSIQVAVELAESHLSELGDHCTSSKEQAVMRRFNRMESHDED
eukprot:3801040-Rhodomonas_salina.2